MVISVKRIFFQQYSIGMNTVIATISLHQKLLQTVVADLFKIYVNLFTRCHSMYHYLYKRFRIIMQEIPSIDQGTLY